MKKILFLLFAGALFTAFTSCSSDNNDYPDYYANNPASYNSPTDTTYSCKLSLTMDVLDLFEARVIRTSNFESTVYSFKDEASVKSGSYDCNARSITDQFTTLNNRKVYVKATFTPKPNWQYFLSLNPRETLYLGYTQEYGFCSAETNITPVKVADLTEESVKELGRTLAKQLTKESN